MRRERRNLLGAPHRHRCSSPLALRPHPAPKSQDASETSEAFSHVRSATAARIFKAA